jgi:hypothetical protein
MTHSGGEKNFKITITEREREGAPAVMMSQSLKKNYVKFMK